MIFSGPAMGVFVQEPEPHRPRSGSGIIYGGYYYELSLQGLANNVKCDYDVTTPLRVRKSKRPWTRRCLQCSNTPGIVTLLWVGEESFSRAPTASYMVEGTANTLISWACKADSDVRLYLQKMELASQDPVINITCVISSLRAQVYEVAFTESVADFTVWNGDLTQSAINKTFKIRERARMHNSCMQHAMTGVGDLIPWAQNSNSNLFADSVDTFEGPLGYRVPDIADLFAYRSEGYSGSLEEIIQQILEY